MKRWILVNKFSKSPGPHLYVREADAKRWRSKHEIMLEVELDELSVVNGIQGEFNGQKWSEVQSRLPEEV